MKRFYKLVSMKEGREGFSVLLDGRRVKTPNRALLSSPYKRLMQEIIQEWASQGEQIIPSTMPLTQILNTRIDRVSRDREEMTNTIIKYLDTDLICYRTAHPPELARRQQEIWDPWLRWFETEFGVILETTTDLKALKQPQAAHQAIDKLIRSLDDDQFTALQIVVPVSGSLILALAFLKQAASSEQVFDAARIEERFKAELYNEKQYGPDPMQEKQDQAALADLRAAAKFLDLLS